MPQEPLMVDTKEWRKKFDGNGLQSANWKMDKEKWFVICGRAPQEHRQECPYYEE
jgi:hypothetical protein